MAPPKTVPKATSSAPRRAAARPTATFSASKPERIAATAKVEILSSHASPTNPSRRRSVAQITSATPTLKRASEKARSRAGRCGARRAVVRGLIHRGGERLQILPARKDRSPRLLGRRRTETVPEFHLAQPGLQFVEVLLILLKLGEGELPHRALPLELGVEVTALTQDLHVLGVARLPKGPHQRRLVAYRFTSQKVGRPTKLPYLLGRAPHRPLARRVLRQRRYPVLQVNRPSSLELPPHARPKAGGLGRQLVDQDEPATPVFTFVCHESSITVVRIW